MPYILHRRHRIDYQISAAHRRKTIALRVHRDGTVEVRAPSSMSRARIRQFVAKRGDWVLERRRYFLDLARRHPRKEFRNGEAFPILGRQFRLRLERQPGLEVAYCRTDGGRLKLFLNGQTGSVLSKAAFGAIRDWYSELTRKKAVALIRRHAKALAVQPGKLRIGDQAKRWASCSNTGDIRCNWRLSMMPMPVFEYVIVHELCHLKTHDHSSRFWRTLKSVLPDYEKRRDWLRREGPGLAVG